VILRLTLNDPGLKREIIEMLTHYKSVCLKIVLNIQRALEAFHYFSTTKIPKNKRIDGTSMLLEVHSGKIFLDIFLG